MTSRPVATPAAQLVDGRGCGTGPTNPHSHPFAKPPSFHTNPHWPAPLHAKDTHDVTHKQTATPNRGTRGVADHTVKSTDLMSLWASNAVTQLLDGQDDPPAYGSPAWRRLPGDDPRRAAAILTAAESWRRFGHEDMSVIEAAEMWRRYGSDQVLTWFREASVSHRPLADRRTLAELDEAARPKPAHQLRAAPGWPPVRLPGRPGWRRHLVDGQQIDLRDNAQESAA